MPVFRNFTFGLATMLYTLKWARKKNWITYGTYALLSLAILGVLLRPGYILSLDGLFAPNMDFMAFFYGLHETLRAALPFDCLIQLASWLEPAWLWQKLVLFTIMLVAGLGIHKLAPKTGVGPYFAGILYMVNPFTYVRFLAGQWGVLWAYALTPFAIKGFLELLENPNCKNAIKVTILSTLVGLLQIHGFFLLFLALLILFLFKMMREHRDRVKTFLTSKYVAMSAGVFWGLNLYWLLPVLTAKDTIVSQLTQVDLFLFAPKATSRIMFDIASMHGFWRGGYVYTQDVLPFWWLLFLFLLYLVVYGFVCGLKDNRHRWMVISFATIGLVTFLLAVGAATNLTRPLFEWLWDHLPFFSGFRDSHKFVALLCLCYAYLGGLGVNEIGKALKSHRKVAVRVVMAGLVAIALLTPLGYSFLMFGFYGQLGVTDYPEAWYEIDEYLNSDDEDFNVLFLPWHQYMHFSWLPNRDKVLANPARVFFDKPVIQGDNIEMPGIYSQSTNPISKYVEFLLSRGSNIDNLGELLAPLNVKYVILVNEADYEAYDFLYRQKDLTLKLARPGITVFRNEHRTARLYAVDSVVHVDSLEEYLELSNQQDVMEHVYVMGREPIGHGGERMEQLGSGRKSPVRYSVGGSSLKYTAFTVPQNVSTRHWEYNGEEPVLQNLGFMPVFKTNADGGEIVYSRFYRFYLPGYIISALSLAFIVFCYFRSSRSKRL